jgi:translation initiation factor 5B
LSNIKLQERGVYVQASTLGSLEALLEFLRTSKIPVSRIVNNTCLLVHMQ